MRLLLLLWVAVALSACATLNRSECETADWRVIGYEDGAHGRALSYLAKHRKACADYGIRPNMDRYEMGRQAGLQEYCTPRNGFRLGRKGYPLNTQCPAPLADDFQHAWSQGHELYGAELAHRDTQKHIDTLVRQQAELVEQRASVEQVLIHDGITAHRRRHLLREMNELDTEIRAIEYERAMLEDQLELEQIEVDRLRAMFLY